MFSKPLNWELRRESYEKNVCCRFTDSSNASWAEFFPSFSSFGITSAYLAKNANREQGLVPLAASIVLFAW